MKSSLKKIITSNPNAFGICMMLISGIGGTGLGVSMRLVIETGYHSSQVAFLRGIGGILCCMPIVYGLVKKSDSWRDVIPNRIGLVIIRSIAIGFAISLAAFSIARIPLAEFTAISFITPVFLTLIAGIIFQESVGIRRVLAVIVGFIGVYLLLDPQNSGMSVGKWGALGFVATTCCSLILGKILSRTNPIIILVLCATTGMSVVAGVMSIPHWQPLTPYAYTMIIVMGLCGNIGQWAFTTATAVGEISVIMPFDYMKLLYGVLAGYFLFAEIPTGSLWAGSALIIAAALYTSLREHKRQRERTLLAKKQPPD